MPRERRQSPRRAEQVNHPSHYGGKDNPYEAIKVIDAWELGFCLGNTVKYIARAGRKAGASVLVDLKKSLWYLSHEIGTIEAAEARRLLARKTRKGERKRK
jgi:hypothetical protein